MTDPNPDPNPKRARVDVEPKHRKQKKTTYFFRPENKLTRPTEGPIDRVHRDQIELSDHQNHSSTSTSRPNPKSSGTNPTTTDADPYDAFLAQNQSSDESFEGIKWKLSPSHYKNTPRKPNVHPSSSPLKNVVDTGDTLSAVINEQAEQMLLKYGSGFQNISSQTGSKKMVSDLGRAGHRSLDTPPSLQRAKSMGALGSESRLKTWISMIDQSNDKSLQDLNHPDTNDILRDILEHDILHHKPILQHQDILQPKALQHKENSPNKESPSKESPSNSEDFSDDDILDTYAARTQSMPLPRAESRVEPTLAPEVKSSPPLQPKPLPKLEPDPFDDSFDDFDLSKMDIEPEPQTEFSTKITELQAIDDGLGYEPKLAYSRPDLKRYKITNLLQTSYKIDSRQRKQTILTVRSIDNIESKFVLRGEYCELELCKGDIINIVITEPKSPNLIDDNQNMLIWHPDVLVSATTVSQQLDCPRKSVLTSRFKFPSSTSLPLIVGVILHEVFQSCFVSENWSQEYTSEMADALVDENILGLFSIGSTKEEARAEIDKSLPYLREWFLKYYRPKGTGTGPRGRGTGASGEKIPTTGRDQVYFSVNKALDIEENIWSPMFGLKGKVDVTLEGNLKSPDRKGTFLIPMEIKTGREYLSHHAQSSLYALLFKDRYDIDVSSFLLVYTKEKLTKLGDIKSSDLKSLVNLRNRIAAYLREGIREYPEVIRRSTCDRCDVQETCMTLHYLVEDGTSESSGLKPDRFDEIVGHIDTKNLYKDFFNYWDMLITKEELLMNKLRKELWTLTAKERELKSGNALANMVISEYSEVGNQPFRFSYTFVRANHGEFDSLQNSQLTKFDRVIISDQEGHFTIAYAFITIIRPTMIVVNADRRIINSSVKEDNFSDKENQVYQGVLSSNLMSPTTKLYRIDKDNMFHGMGLARHNIVNLLLPNGDSKRRQQIVDLKPPWFNAASGTISDPKFNSDQLQAVNKVLSAEDYCLILGMPGTGKTTLIAGLINHLVSQGQSVLLASYTHSAVDNILLKVKEYNVGILRVGNPSKVHKDIKQFVPQKIDNFDQYMHMYMDPPVIGTTCLGITDPVFNIRSHFDYCIIDEASQVSFPTSLGPLKFCEKFILVGDHNQLPPLVQHQHHAVKRGLSQSLFQYLNHKFPESVVELTYQYRMSADIMKLSNLLIYNNRLKCGTEAVAAQKLRLPNPLGYKAMVRGEKDIWMQWVLNENNNVIFLDHDLVPATERVVGEKVENPMEALLIWQIIEALSLCGITPSQIGVMSLYRAQLRLLNKYLLDRPEVEVMTADQFQGRDKECVVISLVRSNSELRVGDLLQEWRRINVAITRSKSKLIILGSRKTLSLGDGVLKEFLELVFKEKWMYRLPPKANCHYTQPPPGLSQVRSGKRPLGRNNSTSTQSPLRGKVTRDSRAVKDHQLIQDVLNESS